MARIDRVGGIDFWRGAVLVAIMIDHIPGNILEYLTPRNFGISDSAEAFVFLSGLSVGFTYVRKAERHGMRAVARGAIVRALRIYGIHLALTLGAFVIFGLGYWLCGLPDLIRAHGRDLLFEQPGRGVVGVLLLSHQLGYFNILPLYVVLMLVSPAMIALARASRIAALAISLAIYASTAAFGLSLPNWPQPGGWFFNPFAWQLLFMLGILAAIEWRDAPLPNTPPLRAGAWTVLAIGAVVMTDMAGLTPGLYSRVFALFSVGKQNLGLLRLIYFLALAYAIATTPRLAASVGEAAGRALRRLGRHSLQVFAFGSLLSALGQATLAALNSGISDQAAHAFGAIYTLVSIGMLFQLAKFLEWEPQGRQATPDSQVARFPRRIAAGPETPAR